MTGGHLFIAQEANDFCNSLSNARQRSAVLAIHCTWLAHTSDVSRLQPIKPAAPLTMMTLYRAMADTFSEWPPALDYPDLPISTHAFNQDKASEMLSMCGDAVCRALAITFLTSVSLHSKVAAPQDLEYYCRLFFVCLEHHSIDMIVNGAIAAREPAPIDLNRIALDYW